MVTRKLIEFRGSASEVQKLANEKFNGDFTAMVRFIVRKYLDENKGDS